MKNLIKTMAASKDEFIAIRRMLHENPELGFEEKDTSNFVAEKLTEWGYEVHRGLAKTGVVGKLKIGSGNKCLGLRADMDALPIQENSGKAWHSKKPGVFHGCGHDGHTTMLLCAAKHLAEMKNFNGTVHLIFQPAEELLYGGKVMVEDGLFTHFPCDAIFGMHNMPGIKQGEFHFREGPLFASSDTIHIEITGVGAHGAMPERGVDATVIACYIGTALQSIVSRNITPFEPAVVTIGAIQSGDAPNVVNAHAILKLSIRALNNDIRELMKQRIHQIATSVGTGFGATVTLNHINGSPVLINAHEETQFAIEVAKSIVDEEKINEAPLYMASDDFAFMTEINPKSSYVMIGNGDEPGFCNVHNPGYDFNDENIIPGAAFWVALTQKFLV